MAWFRRFIWDRHQKETLLTFYGLVNTALEKSVALHLEVIDSPETEGKLLLALEDSINTKVERKTFGCEQIFDHAAKANQSNYPWV